MRESRVFSPAISFRVHRPRVNGFIEGRLAIVLLLVLIIATIGLPASTTERNLTLGTTSKPGDVVRVREAYGKLPLSFEANRGQADPQVKFLSRSTTHTLF